jgi:hypothetical protein
MWTGDGAELAGWLESGRTVEGGFRPGALDVEGCEGCEEAMILSITRTGIIAVNGLIPGSPCVYSTRLAISALIEDRSYIQLAFQRKEKEQKRVTNLSGLS